MTTLPTSPAPLRPLDTRADRTWPLLAYSAVTAALLVFLRDVVAEGPLRLLQPVLFGAFLLSLLFAFQWKAAGWAKTLVYALGIVFVLPYMGQHNTSYFDLVIQMLIFAALALGLNIVVGLAGLLDLGYIAFFAVGAYLWGIFGSPQFGEITGNAAFAGGVNPALFWLFIPLAVAAAALVGVLIGLPVLKLKGDYLAIVTLGLGEVIRIFANNLEATNGPQGIDGIQSAPVPWLNGLAKSLGFAEDQYLLFFLYLLVLAVIGIVILVNHRLDRSKIGRSWIAIREDEVAAQAMGVPLLRTKLLAFATGASFAGAMGVIFAAKQAFIDPKSFDYFQSIGVLSMVILGGMGNIAGVMVGAVVVTMLNLMVLPTISEVMQAQFPNINQNLDPSKYQRLIFGLVLVFMMLYRPEGLVPSERRKSEMHDPEHNGPAPDSLTAENRLAGGNIGGHLSDGSAGEPLSPGLATRDNERTGSEK
ncbi:ABC transporter permease subunit [Deinococcus wulumuqiensis]|uniref:Branched-chain amino acid ABC transporter permease n=1 Tax=Deinococcus wulumuqiensis TaxID=980427 RepID=A0A345IEY9_9DEIO|nr:branched-chain amino acid ABC transporter permease [Deinococcus wulumuqiensis]AXG98261.1 branched-chain amino acid ABC transporter permease [Deinococcus wulumuqiensis]QII19777.1 branched-chain amino acid ABC transporter permease [Deinococcus wulumuqiensis R12]GGI71676.1 branched-chain amino acid ABC transporter permease [Deinococcus wulumuqiensis]GGP28389.1 branched-chain amino acid ABC transporter permease [Deinococcus wulumuqiensis]